MDDLVFLCISGLALLILVVLALHWLAKAND